MEIKYYVVALFSGVLSAFSQVLLKAGSNRSLAREKQSFLGEYFNPYVIGGYGITLLCMLLMIYAFKGIPYKVGPALETLVYLYVMVLSRVIWKERITLKRLIGNLLIVCGVMIFSL